VNVEIELGGKTPAGIQWRHGDSMSPVVHVVFADTQRRRCARRTQAGPLERFVKAGRQCPSETVVLHATFEVTARGILVHHF
jgi:hypothetical protein